MSIKNILQLSSNSGYIHIAFSCDDAHLNDMCSLIVKNLYDAAKGRNLFVEYMGANPDLECSDNVICKSNEIRNKLKKCYG